MINSRYIFTVVAGRSGQATLTEVLRRHAIGCFPAFEAPSPKLIFSGSLGRVENKFRRKFLETNELLGRGKVLRAFEQRDVDYLEKVAKQRLKMIERDLIKTDSTTYIDISKFFARGLHIGFRKLLPEISLIHLVRDPLANMCSFLNRSKNFSLDNSFPDMPSNLLRLDSRDMSLGELYLWAWCELYLRFEQMIDEGGVSHFTELRTEKLNDPKYLSARLKELDLSFTPIESIGKLNTNAGQGFRETRIDIESIVVFDRFMGRLSGKTLDRIRYFSEYDPRRSALVTF